jgi:hypothetical protein
MRSGLGLAANPPSDPRRTPTIVPDPSPSCKAGQNAESGPIGSGARGGRMRTQSDRPHS